MSLKLRGKTWHMVYRNLDGRITSFSLNTSSREEAERLEGLYMDALRTQRQARRSAGRFTDFFGAKEAVAIPALETPAVPELPAIEPVKPNGGVLVADLLTMAEKRRKITREHRIFFDKFLAFCPVKYAAEVTPQIAQAWLDADYGSKTPKAYNNAKCGANIVFKAAMVEAGLTASPFESLINRPLEGVVHTRDLSDDEVDRLLAASESCPYWHCLIMISVNTGLRLKSCQALAPCHVKDDVITFLPTKTARFGRAVKIPVLPELGEYLRTVPVKDKNTPYCNAFTTVYKYPGTKLPYFTGLLEDLGISKMQNGEKATFHSLRDTFVTRMSKAGISDRVIRGIVGHVNQDMTDLYNHDTDSAIREITAAFGHK